MEPAEASVTSEHAEQLLRIVRAFVNPVMEHCGVPVRLDINCLRDDAAKLIKEIDSEDA
jgi:hypothetical protein